MIQPWHWVLLAFIGGALGIDSTEALLRVALFVLAGFLSILVHEFGHALTGQRFGAKPQIVLHGLGGFAVFPNARFTRKQHFFVIAGGPAIQIVLGFLALALLQSEVLPDTEIKIFVRALAFVSIFWALLNLVPVNPLDGGQMLQTILGPSRIALSLKISIAAAVLSAIAVYYLFGGFIFPLFVLFLAYQNFQLLQQMNSAQK